MNIKDKALSAWYTVTGLVMLEYKIKVAHKVTGKQALLVGNRPLFSTILELYRSTKAFIKSDMNDEYVVVDIERIK